MHYHHLVLRCLAVAALPCVIHAGPVLPPTISLKGIHDASDVHGLYNFPGTGDQQQVTMSENGAKFIMEEFATTDDIPECGGATADEQCLTYDCSSA